MPKYIFNMNVISICSKTKEENNMVSVCSSFALNCQMDISDDTKQYELFSSGDWVVWFDVGPLWTQLFTTMTSKQFIF